MPSEMLSTRDWLGAEWQEGQRLYVVMGNASEANPLQAYYQQASIILPRPIWSGTPYAGWQEVMPYLGELEIDSNFLDWMDEAPTQDRGWLAMSPHPPESVLDHLRSLTQVRMPDGAEVFFRFWDGSYWLPTLKHMGQNITQVLPALHRYWVNGRAVQVDPVPLQPAKAYPWWQVPADLIATLMGEDPSTLVDNLMQWLREEHADLYFALPTANLQLKVERHVRNGAMDDRLKERLLALLEKEAAR
ncbi:DUF4123 domain-containing protein [Pseudomonas sp. L-22-4S-12]|uniref:DUF4123 domain-containing protein n=1 Tax=Pseudomonas sp. L-22-4S-12 TaxID=2610893 RepID=UPI0013207EB3|nr:DUF4123 domain-containing protein [Pseudomonas sp. L-22-4S-12]